MGRGPRNLVSWRLELAWYNIIGRRQLILLILVEHTLLVTDTGVEVLTARLATSPGGPVPLPEQASPRHPE